MKNRIILSLALAIAVIASAVAFGQKNSGCGTVDVQDTTGAEIFAVVDAGRRQGCLSFTVTSLDPTVGKNWRIAGS